MRGGSRASKDAFVSTHQKKKKKKKERRRKNLAVMAKTAKSENFSLLLQRKIRTILAAFTRITKRGEKEEKEIRTDASTG